MAWRRISGASHTWTFSLRRWSSTSRSCTVTCSRGACPTDRGSVEGGMSKPIEMRQRGAVRTLSDSPYVGLSYYMEEFAGLFFGRDSERTLVISNLRAARLTILYAPSGVGKSSLLRAGVAARLRELARRSVAERGSARFIPVVFQSC